MYQSSKFLIKIYSYIFLTHAHYIKRLRFFTAFFTLSMLIQTEERSWVTPSNFLLTHSIPNDLLASFDLCTLRMSYSGEHPFTYHILHLSRFSKHMLQTALQWNQNLRFLKVSEDFNIKLRKILKTGKLIRQLDLGHGNWTLNKAKNLN